MRKRRRTLPGNKNATKAVMRWLDKDHPDYHLNLVYDRISTESLEAFTKDAKAWLNDRSELKTSTVECADWEEVYAYVKKMRGEGMTHIHATAILNGVYRAGECFRDPLALRRAKKWVETQIKQDAAINGQRLDHEVAAKKINAWDGSSPAVDASVTVPVERKKDHYQYTLKNIEGPCVWI